MLYFVKFAKKYWLKLFISFIFVIFTTIINAYFPILIQRIIDEVIIPNNQNKAFALITTLILAYLIHGITVYIYVCLADVVAEQIASDVRNEIFEHSSKQNGEFFKVNSPAELMSRNTHDAGLIGYSFGFRFIFSIEIFILEIVMITALIRMNVYLSIVPILMLPIIGTLAVKQEKSCNAISYDISNETATMNKTAGEAVSGIRTVKAYGKESFEKRRFAKRNKFFFSLNQKLDVENTKYDSLIAFVSRSMLVFVLVLGGAFVIKKIITLGQLAAYIEYTNTLIWPMLELGWVVAMYAESFASAKKIKEVLLFNTEVKTKEPKLELDFNKCELEFEDINLIIDEKQILKNISFKIEKGKSLGIMGPTGSGKTTLINLLTRFLEPSSGSIKINGNNIEHYDVKDLRSFISWISQDVFLFSQTIRENLNKGKMDEINDEEMIKIAKLFEVDKFASHLKESYDTVIGERGVGLSGGQKQRISIARAILKSSPLLVLDDATSALDMKTEKIIQKNLNLLDTKFSKVIITHRISSVRDCDEIIYLLDGEIAERGNHASLMNLKGNYFDTYQAQYGGHNEF